MSEQERLQWQFPSNGKYPETEFINSTCQENDHSRVCWLMKYFQTAWQNEDFCDFTIYCRSKEFKLHRLILASHSEKFRQILKSENPKSYLVLNYYEEEVVKAVVNYLYTKQISFLPGKEKEIKECAAELGIEEIEGVEKLPLPYNIDNVVEKYLVTKRNGIYSENRECLYYMGEWLPDVSQTMKFLLLPTNDLCDVLNSNEIRQANEIEVLKAAIRWLRFDYINRKSQVRSVLSTVKFHSISRDDLNVETARNGSILNTYREETSKPESQVTTASGDSTCAENGREVLTRPCVLAIYGKNMYSAVPGEFLIDASGDWKLVTVLPETRNHPSIVYFNEHIYVIGGADTATKRSSRTAVKYNIESGRWSEIAPMQESRSYCSAVEMGGRIFVVGGRNESKTVLNSMEIYDPEHDRWMYASPASGHCVGSAVIQHLGRLYRFGGDNSKETLRFTEVYDPEKDKWLLRTPLQEDTAFGGVVEINSRLYTIGGAKYKKGYKVLSSIQVYDPVRDSWSYEGELQTPRCDHGTVKIGTKFYTFSGFRDYAKKIDTVECYDTLMRTTVKGSISDAPMAGPVGSCVVPTYDH